MKRIYSFIAIAFILVGSAFPVMPARADSGYWFPWAPGTQMMYNSNGVHDAGFTSFGGVDGWKAVDFVSDGVTAAGHASNMIYAMASGNIQWICKDNTSEAFRIGDLIYAHLQISNLVVGDHFNQGDPIGPLVEGTFSDTCGHSDYAGTFHLHLGFPNTGHFAIEAYDLDTSTQDWAHYSDTISPGAYITSDTNPSGGNPFPIEPLPPPGAAHQENIWDQVLKVYAYFFGSNVASMLPDHRALNLAMQFGSIVRTTLDLDYDLIFSNFNMTVPALILAIILPLEIFRLSIGMTKIAKEWIGAFIGKFLPLVLR
jgi:hypothetical protein